ncbi:MAG: protein-(glutamine-N5) methyltransferase, release factor-specific [Flavobacteriaceae bacterium]|nr:protein-(glutamine-N5) methyltransferase, release factor-specific [Flavobacteriaceae bacterium]
MSCLDVKKTMKLKELKELTQAKLLKIYGIEESRSIFHLLLNEFLGIDVINFHINGDKKISLDSLNLFNEKISLIEKEIPVQYVIGHVIIEGLKIFVNKSVLIPRPETVDLCNWITQKKLNDQVILDIGTGSGLIALFLKKNSNNCVIHAWDNSEKALRIAKKNAKQNYLDINFNNVDILKKYDHTIKFDIIVSNPPYVHKKEKNLISNVVLKNEPSEAIFVNSDDDLLFYKTIINFSKSHLKQKGIIYFECHKETINQVKNLLIINKFTDIEIKKDSFGINRMIKANSYGDA